RIQLGTLGGAWSEAHAVNDLGQVVGWAQYDPETDSSKPFIWEDGVMRAMADEAGMAHDVNNAGVAAGRAWLETYNAVQPVRFEPDETVTTLNQDCWRSGIAYGLNELGQCVGYLGDHA